MLAFRFRNHFEGMTMKETWTQTVERYIREGRTVSGAKGGHSASEQQSADALRQQEFDLTKQSFGFQQKRLAQTGAEIDKLIAQGGMSPQQEAAQRSLLLNTLPEQFRG